MMQTPAYVIIWSGHGKPEILSVWLDLETASKELGRLTNLGYHIDMQVAALNESWEPWIPTVEETETGEK